MDYRHGGRTGAILGTEEAVDDLREVRDIPSGEQSTLVGSRSTFRMLGG